MNFNEDFPYNPLAEKVVDVLVAKFSNHKCKPYFRCLAAFYLTQMASNMRCTVRTPMDGDIPVNMYFIGFMPSGAGKGKSKSLIEEKLIKKFKKNFKTQFQNHAEDTMKIEANKMTIQNKKIAAENLKELQKEFNSYGVFPYDFDSGTIAAFKQVRTKAQMADLGALTFICDELGTNLSSIEDLLKVGLEVFDKGMLKQKIIKNTADSIRAEDRDDPVPTNMLLFGEPHKLFDGDNNEKLFMDYLTTGYARRCFFATGNKGTLLDATAEEIFKRSTDKGVSQDILDLEDSFGNLADSCNIGKIITMSDERAIQVIEYRQWCEQQSNALPPNQNELKIELENRFFKVIKLAGVYAFAEGATEISEDHLKAAIQLAKDSGECFAKLLSRDKAHVMLAKYLKEVGIPVTPADLMEAFPWFPNTKAKQKDLLDMASAWGFKNNIIITRNTIDGVFEEISGTSLPETDLDEILLSYSSSITEGYVNAKTSFQKLPKLCLQNGYNWVVHHLQSNPDAPNDKISGYRSDEFVQEGFNLVVLDIDGTCSMEAAKTVLSEYTFYMYTTKRHQTEGTDRFRVILPIKYTLKLSKEDYKKFMDNIYSWFPFALDSSTCDRARKWSTHAGIDYMHEGSLLDPTPFIPKTYKNTLFIDENSKLNKQNLSHLEKWFYKEAQEGSRNNILYRYATVLKDSGKSIQEVKDAILAFNEKLGNPLPQDEIQQTIFKSLEKSC